MGSGTSKSVDPEAAVSRQSYYSRNMFRTSSCIRPTTGSSDNSDIDDEAKKTDIECNLSNMNSSKSKGKLDRNKKVKRARVPSETHFGEWGESSLSGSSRNRSGCSHNSSSNILSRYSNKTKSHHGCEFFPSCFMPMSARPQDDDSVCSDNTDASSIHELGSNDNNDNGMESNGTLFYPRNVEQNVRFSRTLSVGRLRDRVHNRPTFPELASFPLQSEGEVVSDVDICDTGSRFSDENVTISATSSSYSSSTMTNSLYGNHDFEVENMGARETRYTNILESRANFLERRRRIRSQVRALQRMGSRFENLSGHERSCILSGQHRTGFCTCRLINQDPNGGTDARGSISRIVLLTEALFEVLGEIRQQSIVSSSRPGLSSIGSVPTPTEVVEALPVKLYRKLSKHVNEDDAQCHICLVEYEDGDEVRVLPCHHEFHRFCIDKWLKETHRICPLCRCDVCKTGSLHDESSQL